MAVGSVTPGITLVGLNRLVLGLVPATFLDGHPVAAYSRRLWPGVYAPVLAAFILLVLPATARRSRGNVGVSLVLFARFAGLSVGLWAWLRRTHERGLSMAVS